MTIETTGEVRIRRTADGRKINVAEAERLPSLIGGGALALYGLSRGNLWGGLLAAVGGLLLYRGATRHCLVYEALGVSTAEPEPGGAVVPDNRGVRVMKSVTIQRPAAELFRYWRNFENLPRFTKHLLSVKILDAKTSHWIAKGPTGHVQWDAEIINEVENEMIAWRTMADADIHHAGSIHFTELPGRGTEVRVEINYDPPLGKIWAAAAKLTGEAPSQQVDDDLRRFKMFMEAGELVSNEGPSGRRR